jgi:hypothetical protein
MRIRFIPITAMSSVLAVSVLTGCGSQAAQKAAEHSGNPVVAAAGKAAGDDTARLSLDISAAGDGHHIIGGGVVDLVKGDDGKLTIELPTPRGTAAVDVLSVDGKSFTSEPHPADDAPSSIPLAPGERWRRQGRGRRPRA